MKILELKTTLGFTEGMKPMQIARVEEQLDKRVKYNNTIYSMKEYIVIKLSEGSYPVIMENCWHYKRNGEKSKPETQYRLQTDKKGGTYYFKLNKTQGEFCLYCSEKFKTLDEVKKKDNEVFSAMEKIRLQQEETERIKERKEIERIEKRKSFRSWMLEESKKIPQEQKDIITSIFVKKYGVVNDWNFSLAVCINNFDDEMCKNEIISRLHNDNKASIKIFECLTGLKLPKGYKKRIEYLENITSKDFTVE